MTTNAVLTYPKDSNVQLSTHFNVSEFKCPCDSCKQTLIDKILISQLEAMRTLLGSKLTVTSGYRCEDYQRELRLKGYETSTGISTHQLGKAADVSDGVTPGHELEDLARRVGFMSVGVGKHFVHLDLRPEYRRWTYSY
jgi:uncharacterized protein YcbK (DUF882 family)